MHLPNQTKKLKNHQMKTGSKIFLAVSFVLGAIQCNAQLATRRIYNDQEVILPNNLQYIASAENKNPIAGKIENGVVYISWQTKAEINTSHFELQRSRNGELFVPIETITAGRTTTGISRYSATDEQANTSSKKLYYRIKLVFVNGQESFTEAILLNLTKQAAAEGSILP
jgi:hypothetical protein